jgi:multicomponent Na+:H+ antiporter subunit E
MTADTDQRGENEQGAAAAWFVQCFAVLILVWIALNGFNGLSTGVPAALAAAAVGTAFARSQAYPWHPLRGLVFAGFFLLESFKGGSDVAWRALHPALKIQPEFQSYLIELPEGLPTTLLTSMVSLLPGTLSVRLHETDRRLTVHALTPSAIASVERLERVLGWIFRGPTRAR